MNNHYSFSRMCYRSGFSLVLLALLCCLAPGRVSAAPAPAGPLPLPDLLIYGTVTDSNGDLLSSGTVRVVLREQTIATAEIGEIAGTGYTYLLVVPMAMLAPGSTETPTGVALTDDTLGFFVDNQPAYYQDAGTTLTVSQLSIAKGAAGTGIVLDLSLPGAMRYTLGDVNANGARNAADALLSLKYDIGLIIGVTDFPPGPNTVYLPLCDIVENGRCDSSDALRILQCDVGMSSVTCPVDTVPAARTLQAPLPGAATTLRLAAREGSDLATVDVRVQLEDGAERFGAASLELHYDPALFAPIGCRGDQAGVLDLVACNPHFAPGAVRFNALAADGGTAGSTLAEVQFQRIGAVGADLATHFALVAEAVADPDGNDLAWRPVANGSAAPSGQFWLYLPAVAGQSAAADGQSLAEQTLVTPTLDLVAPPSASPPVEATPVEPPPVEPIQAQPATGQSIYLPTISSQQGAVAAPANPTDGAPAEPEQTDAAPIAAPPPPAPDLPPPTETPVAVLPAEEETVDDGNTALYLPLLNGE